MARWFRMLFGDHPSSFICRYRSSRCLGVRRTRTPCRAGVGWSAPLRSVDTHSGRRQVHALALLDELAQRGPASGLRPGMARAEGRVASNGSCSV